MNQETRSSLQSATQELRKLLEVEFSEQLSGIYDILPDGTIPDQPGQHLVDPKQRLIRRKVVETIEHLIDGGKPAQEAIQDYIREASFTFLNRIVALRMMEAKKLLQPCVSRGDQSIGFKEFCGLAAGLASLPDGGYRLYLECLFDELSVEIRVLFSRRDAASLLWPRRPALGKLLDILARSELNSAWSDDATIGWVYQFFIELEKKEVFDRIYKKKQKIKARDIPAATQIFTPRWIVRFLIENTVGRLWMDMHPDSNLAASLEYLVPIDGNRTAALKPVKEIRLLDPSCGTMHFGLVAFDLFAAMYHEEFKHAGSAGWPEQASIESEEEIPAAILKNNLYGIDIDPRAVQLSALTLYLKAKEYSPKVRLTETRLACADIHMLNGEHLGAFLDAAGLDKRPIYGRILKAMQQRLKDAEQLGSLLRLEEEIRMLVDKERKLFAKEGRQADLFGWSAEQFESEAGRREFWETLEVQVGQALDAFAREQAELGRDQSFFSGETTKGLRLLEVMNQQYDVVVTNPPYMTARNMNEVLKGYVDKNYSKAKGDLYAAFIQRCTEWLIDHGRVGMVTQQSFMYISSYEKLREFLRTQVAIETLPHVGPRAFEEVDGEKVNTTLLVFRKEVDATVREKSVGTYFRLVNERDAESKRIRFEQALKEISSGRSDPIVFKYPQADFDVIPESPWVYSIVEETKELFRTHRTLNEVAPARPGAATSENIRFLRGWWEVGINQIDFNCKDIRDGEKSQSRWFPYMKGGGFKRWYGNQQWVVKFGGKAFEMKEAVNIKREKFSPNATGPLWSAKINSYEYYFRRGVTYSYLTSGAFNARISPGGFIFDVAGSSMFPEDELSVLGLLNSKFVDFLLKVLNPTVNFQVGDLARLPVPGKFSQLLRELVTEAINLARLWSCEDETTWDFVAPPDFASGLQQIADRSESLSVLEQQINSEVLTLYGVTADHLQTIEIEHNVETEVTDEVGASPNEDDEEAEPENSVRWDRLELARAWIAYAVGIVIGRFEPGTENALGRGRFSGPVSKQLRSLASTDGVMVLDPGHPHDLAAKVVQALTLMLGDKDTREVIHEATSRDGDLEEELRRYMNSTYFKEHLQKYLKRPIYWLLQSPRKTYGIYLFHENITKDTFYRLRSDQYVGSKLNLLNERLTALQLQASGASGRELKSLQKTIEETEASRDDLQEFMSKIDCLITLGYDPNIDDGVLINMAPLWQLIPSWSAEPKKCWEKLVAGDYDWSHMAMHLWPERVIPKCVENASYAIAHGLDSVFWTVDDRERFQSKPKPSGGWKSTVDKLISERARPGIKDAIEAISHSGAKPKSRSKKKGGQA